MSNLATGLWQDATTCVVLVVQNKRAPSVEDWDRYMEQIALGLKHGMATGLALTDGGAPNAAQRRQVNDLLSGRHAPSAVVTDSTLVRGVVTALSWFNRQTAAFGPRSIMDAFRFARVEGSRARAVWDKVLALNDEITPHSQTVESAAASVHW